MPAPASAHSEPLLQLDCEGFTMWLDCARRGAVRFQYTLTRDQGNRQRHDSFYFDPNGPAHCQQTPTDSYQRCADERFERGHLVPANHAYNSTDAIRQSNTMTNALPQASNMNRGAWLQTEEIAECYRDIEPVTVIGGVIWGDNPRTDCVATRKRLDQYLVSIAELEARTGETIPVDDWRKEDVPEVSWMIPVGYDRW